jgi:putative metallohydrolase (TIGR04338 family)
MLNWINLPESRWRVGKGKSLGERDTQRQKVYNAEYDAMVEIDLKGLVKRIEKVEEIQKFVNAICSKQWFLKRFGPHKIEVENGAGKRSACGGHGSISMPRWSRQQLFILHEVTHCLQHYKNLSWHGRYFAKAYLELVRFVLGKEVYTILKRQFRSHKVKFMPRPASSARSSELARRNLSAFMKKTNVEAQQCTTN